MFSGLGTGESRDAAGAGGDAFFGDNFQRADLGRVGQMRAAAELAAKAAHADHAGRVGIFFAEEHHGAGGASFGERNEAPLDRLGSGNAFGDVVLNTSKLFRIDGRGATEVETQPVVLDLGAH